jgi:hypothetical protein
MQSSYETLIARMTVAQFAETSGITVASLVDLETHAHHHPVSGSNGHRAAPTKTGGRGRRAAGASAGASVETRTPAGRARLEQAVLASLQRHGEPIRAVEIRAEVGGTAAQVRARLNALVADGRIGERGQSSGKRYFLTRSGKRRRARGE